MEGGRGELCGSRRDGECGGRKRTNGGIGESTGDQVPGKKIEGGGSLPSTVVSSCRFFYYVPFFLGVKERNQIVADNLHQHYLFPFLIFFKFHKKIYLKKSQRKKSLENVTNL